MKSLYEEGDMLQNPVQCFYFEEPYCHLPVSPHWHYYMEIVYVLKGKIKVYADKEEYFAEKGDMILLHPLVVHAFYHTDDNEVTLAGVKLDIGSMTQTSYYSPKLRSIFRSAQKKKETILFPKEYCDECWIRGLFEKSIQESYEKNYGYDLIINSHLYRILIEMIRYWQKNGFTIDQDSFAENENYDIYNILQYIAENLDGDLKVTDVAQSCGLSYSYFAKRFQTVYGKSCKEYIEDMRVYKAEELLNYTDFDLTTIAQKTGFSDCSHFIKSFKQRRKITPKQFRIQNSRKSIQRTQKK